MHFGPGLAPMGSAPRDSRRPPQPFVIRKGGPGLTGKWLSSAWFCYGPFDTLKFRYCDEAKAYAAQHGASGQWVRSEEPVGPRGRKCVTFRDFEQINRRET